MSTARPWVAVQLDPPGQKDTPNAPKEAAARLSAMGPMTLPQKVMGGTLLGAVVLWMFGDLIGISAVVAAMLGLSVLLLSGVLEWKDCLSATAAWDTLAWFAVLIGMSNAMNDAGIISYFANQIGSVLSSMNLGWPALFALLHIAFFYIHYLFASQTAHVGALFGAFLALMLTAGVPPMLAVLSLAFNVCPSACHVPCLLQGHFRFSTFQVVIYPQLASQWTGVVNVHVADMAMC
jgi:divalent anion:Na+ symporter, DASS family